MGPSTSPGTIHFLWNRPLALGPSTFTRHDLKFSRMELPNLGKHCSFKECNKLDFLPFKCISGCGKSFCGDHYKKVFIEIFILSTNVKISNLKTLQEIHKCSSRDKIVRTITCPLCSKSVPIVDVTGNVLRLSTRS